MAGDRVWFLTRSLAIEPGRVAPTQFLSQPFVVGDRVEILTSGGGRVLAGTVERVDPMRTILRSDAEVPTTIPNKVPNQHISVLPVCPGDLSLCSGD